MEKVKDTIYRQDAVDALDEIESEVADGEGFRYEKWREYFCDLSSAQLEITDEQAIEHLQESGWMQNHDKQMYEMGLKEQLADDSGSYDSLIPNKDCISRQAAIDTSGLDEEIRCEMCKNPMHTNRGCDGHCKYDEKLYERIMQILDERITPLPSADPERKMGKWICVDNSDGFPDWLCSECGKPGRGDYFYCPWCNADMREGQNE